MGHFSRDGRAKGNQDSRRRDVGYNGNKTRDNGRRPAYHDDSKALVTIDGKDINWSGYVDEDAQNYVMTAYSASNSGSDNEVKSCSKACEESYSRLKKLYDDQRNKLSDASIKIIAYTLALKKVEAQLLCHQQNQLAYEQKISSPPMTWIYMPSGPDVEIDYSKFTYGPKQTLADELDSKPSEYASCESDSSVETSTSMPKPVENASKVFCKPKVWTDAPIIEEYESDSDNDSVSKVQEDKEKPSFTFTDSVKHVKTSRENIKETSTTNHSPKIKKQDRNGHTRKGLGYAFTRKACFVCGSFSHLIRDCDFHEKRMAKQAELTKSKNKDDPHRALKDKGIIYSGCSSNGRITGKGNIKTGRLDFEDVYYVEELKHYNLFSVSQMCDKKKKVLFTDTDCLVLSLDFKLPDENQILLKIPRQHNMYSFNLKNIDPSRDLSCLFAKASIDESNKCRRRLGHINKPNVAGKGHAWMFDLDYLINSMNYEPVLVENQANKSAGPKEANNSACTQANDDQGASSIEIDLSEEHFVLPIWSAYSTTVKSSGDKIKKTTNFKTCEKPVSQVEQVFLKELEKLKRQEKEANDAAESLRNEASHDIQNASTSSTNLINTGSTPLSIASPSRAFTDGELSYTDPSKYALPDDPSMSHLEDIYASPSEGTFTDSSYDDEGVVTDFNNLETTVSVSPTPTTRIHTIHPKTQILGDLKLAVQTRSKVNKNSKAHSYLPFGKKAIRTKWVYRNKKDERGIVVRNKARLVAQGHRQKEGIDYDEVFAPVARIEAITIFLAVASYMGFIVYQINVKSSFLYGTINKEVYVSKPLSFVDPKFPNKKSWCDEFEELMKNRFQMSSMGELNFFLRLQVKQKEDVCACSRFQVTPKTSHLHAVKRIFRYLKGQPKLGLWYPKVSSFDLEAYSDKDYAGANLDMKFTTGGCQFLDRRLIS
nr:ribonuclease H-like domain-containing protein [Tanacetum cinerariifolium]